MWSTTPYVVLLFSIFISAVFSATVSKDNGNARISWYGNTGVDVNSARVFDYSGMIRGRELVAVNMFDMI